jgi:hypothetical protein
VQPNGEKTLTLGASEEMRTGSAEASGRVEDPEVQGTQYVGASNGEETLTLEGSKGMRTSSAAASARVEDPEACISSAETCTNDAAASARAEGPEVQGTLKGSQAIVPSSASVSSTEAARGSKAHPMMLEKQNISYDARGSRRK